MLEPGGTTLMVNCSKCPYKVYPKIPSPTPRECILAIVGEAPGTTEIVQKKPFVGASGKLLRQTLNKSGFTNEEIAQSVYITNSMLCRPPAGKPISTVAVDNCRGRLLEELNAAKPRVILALGNTSLHALTGNHKLKITQEQGRVVWSNLVPGVKIVPAFHPAKILRTPADYKTFHVAVSYAVSLARGGPIKHPGKTNYIALKTPEEVLEAVEFLKNYNLLVGDIETTGFSPIKNRILVLGICYEPGEVIIVPAPFIKYLKPLFDSPNIKWVWHNGKFDTAFLRRVGMKAMVHHDTILLHYCLNENTGTHDLEQLASLLLGAEDYKDSVKKYAPDKEKGYQDVPPHVLYPYLARDCDYTRKVFDILLPKVESDPNLKKLYYDLLLKASSFLQRVERNGLYLNNEAVENLKKMYLEQLHDLRVRITECTAGLWNPEQYKAETKAKTASADFNASSPKQLAWLLYDRLMLKPKKAKGRSTAEEAVKELKGMHPVIELVLELRSVRKMLSTYVVGFKKRVDPDGRVRTSYLIHGTATGRLSSRKPNVQNVPKEPVIRNIIKAAPGFRLMEADYKGAELRVLAELSRDKFLMDVFVAGRDLHDEVSIMLFGPNFTEAQRMRAKAVNFGIPYGRTAESIAEEHKIPVAEAQKMIDEWLRRALEAKAYLESCDEYVLKGILLVTPFGRYRRFGLVIGQTVEDQQREARNFRIQSIASDLTLISAMTMEKRIAEYGAKIINLVHDSILIEYPDDLSLRAPIAKIVSEVMTKVPIEKLNAKVPFIADLKDGYEWGSLEKFKI
jgi:DNA polymerase-1